MTSPTGGVLDFATLGAVAPSKPSVPVYVRQYIQSAAVMHQIDPTGTDSMVNPLSQGTITHQFGKVQKYIFYGQAFSGTSEFTISLPSGCVYSIKTTCVSRVYTTFTGGSNNPQQGDGAVRTQTFAGSTSGTLEPYTHGAGFSGAYPLDPGQGFASVSLDGTTNAVNTSATSDGSSFTFNAFYSTTGATPTGGSIVTTVYMEVVIC